MVLNTTANKHRRKWSGDYLQTALCW